MLSLKTLLNPAPPGPDVPMSLQSSPILSSPAFSATTDMSTSTTERAIMPKLRLSKDSTNLAKSKLRGPIKYPPFESLDEGTLLQVQKFQIIPFGEIHQSGLHIPYNSGKKDFFTKTGRESFEVFRYEFMAPDHDVPYSIMWDYNVGLVRMTPFFKCCQYGKTMPAKMLGLNPGLKEITHSITGGAITAQGYWMPYQCARAVCATFCYHIAGALIPIFGPTFPSDCVRPESADFGRMIIDPRLVTEATQEAEFTRQLRQSSTAPCFTRAASHPRRARTPIHNTYAADNRKAQVRPRLVCDPSWLAGTEAEVYHCSAPNSASSNGSGLHGYMVTSNPSSSWPLANLAGPPNDTYIGANPWLSAVPRSAPLPAPSDAFSALPYMQQVPRYRCKRSASPSLSMDSVAMSNTRDTSPARGVKRKEQGQPGTTFKHPPFGSGGMRLPTPLQGAQCHKKLRATSF